jgi:hypothetical protein
MSIRFGAEKTPSYARVCANGELARWMCGHKPRGRPDLPRKRKSHSHAL